VKGLVGGTKPTFTPATAGAGSYQVIYTDTNGVASDPVTVTVLATAANTFTVKSAVNDVNGVPVITANFVPDTQNNSFQYQWQFGPGFNVTSSTEELPQLTATLDPTGGQTETTASLVVSNGTCSQAAVTKNLIISPNGVFEVAANTGILSGIKNLFNKKG
jgi:Rieske Fe-S protein